MARSGLRHRGEVGGAGDRVPLAGFGSLPATWSAARRLADRWKGTSPKAVACLRADLDDLLTCFRYPALEERKAVRTTNAIERRFREVRRRARPMGTFQDRTSMERILFAVFLNENRNQGLATPFALTQTF
jgi:transposase-like protein